MPKKEKKEKKGKKEAEAPAEPAAPAGPWECPECGETENAPTDEICVACEEPRPKVEGNEGDTEDDKYKGLVVGEVLEAEEIAGKDNLKQLSVNVGAGEPLTLVTNAKNVQAGVRVVVATIGSTVTIKGDETAVKKASVGGVVSEGMLCDPPMLGWTGGGAGNAALVPATFEAGVRPPPSRPRMDV